MMVGIARTHPVIQVAIDGNKRGARVCVERCTKDKKIQGKRKRGAVQCDPRRVVFKVTINDNGEHCDRPEDPAVVFSFPANVYGA